MQSMELMPKRRGICAIDDRELVGAAIYFLAHGCTYTVLQNQFGISAAHLNGHMRCLLSGIIGALIHDEFGKMSLPVTREEAIIEAGKWSSGSNGRFEFLDRCISAADGSLVPIILKKDFQPERWRCRKQFTAQNVLAFTDYNRCFQAMWVMGEGCAGDSTMISWTHCENFILDGFFCLFDAGGINSQKMVTPYRNTRYHLAEWSGIQPTTKEELFNLRHSSRRSRSIECAFGIWKARWRILRSGIVGDVELIRLVTRSTAFLHNFCSRRSPISVFEIHQLVQEEASSTTMAQLPSHQNEHFHLSESNSFRDQLANKAWLSYTNNLEIVNSEIAESQLASYYESSTPNKSFF